MYDALEFSENSVFPFWDVNFKGNMYLQRTKAYIHYMHVLTIQIILILMKIILSLIYNTCRCIYVLQFSVAMEFFIYFISSQIENLVILLKASIFGFNQFYLYQYNIDIMNITLRPKF